MVISKLFKVTLIKQRANSLYILSELFAKSSNVLIMLLIPALVSVKDYGLISLLYSVEVIFTSAIFFGHDESVFRFFNRMPVSRAALFSYYYKWFCKLVPLVGFFVSVAVVLMWVSTGKILYMYFLAMIFSAYCLTQVRFASIFLRLHNQPFFYFFYRVGAQIVRLVMVLVAVLSFKSARSYSLGVIFSGLLGLLAPFFFKKSLGKYSIMMMRKKKYKPKKILNRCISSFSFPVLVANIAGLLYLYIDKWLLAFFLNMHAVGIYSFAVSMGSLIFFIFSILSLLYLPDFYAERGFSVLARSILKKYIKTSLLCSSIMMFFCSLFFYSYIKYIDPEYSAGANVFVITLLSFFIYPLYLYGMYKLKLFRKVYLVLVQVLLSLVFNACLNIILIPLYGIDGAAISTLSTVVFDIIFINVMANCRGINYATA